jgi:hypothetical protein
MKPIKTVLLIICILISTIGISAEKKEHYVYANKFNAIKNYTSLNYNFLSNTVNPNYNTDNIEEFTDWLFINSDKAIQVRYKLEKMEGDIGYFIIQFRINFEDEIFCKSLKCEGYYFTYGYPDLNLFNSIYSHYKFYNTFKGIYSMPGLIPLKLKTRNGNDIYMKKDGFYFMFNNNELQFSMSYSCVDEILNSNNLNRCTGSYRDIYDESKAIIIK